MFCVFSISDGFATGPEKKENLKIGDKEYEGGGSSNGNEKCDCKDLDTHENLYNCTDGCQKKYGTKSEYECKDITSYISNQKDCNEKYNNGNSACKLWVTGNRADEFQITLDCMYPNEECRVTSANKQYGIVAMVQQGSSDQNGNITFYNMTFSCLRQKGETHLYLNSYYSSGIKTNNGCEYRNPSLNENHTDDEYNRYKEFFKDKKFCILKKNGTISNEYNRFKSYTYGWSKSGNGRHSIVVNGIVKYLKHGYFSAYVRLFCDHDDDGNAYVSTLRELKGSYGGRQIHCLYGYKPNDGETDCVPNHVVCKPGTYLPKGEKTCKECEEGFYCPGSQEKIEFIKSNNNEKYLDYRNPGGIFVFNKKITNKNGTEGIGQGIHKCETVKTPVEAIPEQTFGGKGDYSSKGVKSDNDCYYKCDNNQYFPARSTNSKDCEECPNGYYCTGGLFHESTVHQGIKLCPGGKDGQYLGDNKECRPCSELYTGNQDTEQSNKDVIVSEPKFKLEFFSKEYESTTDGKPSGFAANNSNSNSNKAKKSCYISGGVYKNWGEGNNSELELYGDCFYGIDDNNSGSNPSQNDIEVTDCSGYCTPFNGGSYDKDQCEACIETCKNECRNKYYDSDNFGKCEEKCNSQNPDQEPPGLI